MNSKEAFSTPIRKQVLKNVKRVDFLRAFIENKKIPIVSAIAGKLRKPVRNMGATLVKNPDAIPAAAAGAGIGGASMVPGGAELGAAGGTIAYLKGKKTAKAWVRGLSAALKRFKEMHKVEEQMLKKPPRV